MSVGGIQPDDKDWTWVLDRTCPECGFDATEVDVRAVGVLIRANARSWRVELDAPADSLRHRPRPDRWSTLEYAAHVRDVHRLYLERLTMMLDDDDPLYPNWDQDETASSAVYNEQDPATVATELAAAADDLAAGFDGVGDDQWSRPGRRSDGAAFTIETFARYLIHDPIHHLWDVRSSVD
jgi:hypothetical protein